MKKNRMENSVSKLCLGSTIMMMMMMMITAKMNGVTNKAKERHNPMNKRRHLHLPYGLNQ